MGLSIGSLFPPRLRLWLGKQLYGDIDSRVVRVSPHRPVKGPCDPPEVEAMQYIAEHTNIPIPKLHAIHITPNKRIYIEMEYIQGDNLHTAWRNGRLRPEQKQAVFADIKEYISILRELQPPAENLVGSALQNPVYDGRVGSRFFGPFDHHDFHSLIRGRLPMSHVAGFFGAEVAEAHTASYRTCFTHADLVARNIIVRNGRVAAIVDWAFAGWYPEYWEFTKAHYDVFPGDDWSKHLHETLSVYDDQLVAERTLWGKYDDPGTPATLYRDGVTRERPGSKPSAEWLERRRGCQPKDLWSIALSSGRHKIEF